MACCVDACQQNHVVMLMHMPSVSTQALQEPLQRLLGLMEAQVGQLATPACCHVPSMLWDQMCRLASCSTREKHSITLAECLS